MLVHSKVNNKQEHNGCDNNISKDYKMDESRIIIDWNEQGDGSYDIRVVGYRNFKQHFSEAFREIAFKLKDDGVTEEEYKIMLNRVLPGWFNDEDMKKRIRTLLDILFHTFF